MIVLQHCITDLRLSLVMADHVRYVMYIESSAGCSRPDLGFLACMGGRIDIIDMTTISIRFTVRKAVCLVHPGWSKGCNIQEKGK